MIPEMISCFISKQIETDHSYFRYRFTKFITFSSNQYPFIRQSISTRSTTQSPPSSPKRKQRHLTDQPVNTKLRLCFAATRLLSTLHPVSQQSFSVFHMKEKPQRRRKSRSSAVYQAMIQSLAVCAPERGVRAAGYALPAA